LKCLTGDFGFEPLGAEKAVADLHVTGSAHSHRSRVSRP
jgi:hypothetical protein